MHCVELTVLSNIKLMYIVNITNVAGVVQQAGFAVDKYHLHTDPHVAPYSCSRTVFELHAWWAVDLGVQLSVAGIHLTSAMYAGTLKPAAYGESGSVRSSHQTVSDCVLRQ